MSIPSAGHTIYSFITLCLKEHRDVARRKEIAAGIEVGGKESDAIVAGGISQRQLYRQGASLYFGASQPSPPQPT